MTNSRPLDDACPLALSHDRLHEAHWFLHEMIRAYHHPQPFRYYTNAFLHSTKSFIDMIRIDLEKIGENSWRKNRVDQIKREPIFASISRGRDIVVHRGSLINGSSVELGLFRNRQMKSAITTDIKTDEPSHDLLRRLQLNPASEVFVHPDHPFIGEQLGVRRTYREKNLSVEEDVLTTCDLAWQQVHQVLIDGHDHLQITPDDDETECLDWHAVGLHDTWLETDADSSLIEKWHWD